MLCCLTGTLRDGLGSCSSEGQRDLGPMLVCPPEAPCFIMITSPLRTLRFQVFYPLPNTERGVPDAEFRQVPVVWGRTVQLTFAPGCCPRWRCIIGSGIIPQALQC